MRCPFCASEDSQVVDSRDSEAGDAVRRRRECIDCERRYTTYERVEEVPLVVVKRSGDEECSRAASSSTGCCAPARSAASLWSASSASPTRSKMSCGASPGPGLDESRSVSARCVTSSARQGGLHPVRSVYRQFEDIDEFQQSWRASKRRATDRCPASSRAGHRRRERAPSGARRRQRQRRDR